jgi:hypothetical protein
VWLIILSDQLPIVALVGHYPTSQLIGRRFIFERPSEKELYSSPSLCGIVSDFSPVSLTQRQIPTCYSPVRHALLAKRVRLACVRHAASVYPEPGSNSYKVGLVSILSPKGWK